METTKKERLNLEAAALNSFCSIAKKVGRRTNNGTLGFLLRDIKYVLMEANERNLDEKEIMDLPIAYWNLNNLRANIDLNFCDRCGEDDEDDEELAELPSDYYVELFDRDLPIIDKDAYECEGEA